MSTDVLTYKVERNGKRLDVLEDWRGIVDAYRAAQVEKEKAMHEDLQTLIEKVDGLYKQLLITALALAGSSVTFALTALTLTGKL